MYEGSCSDCQEEVEAGKKSESDVGTYIGESSRTLAERYMEHKCRGKAFDPENFIIKHWVINNPQLERRPKKDSR